MLKNFANNDDFIEAHNKKISTYKLGHNQFSHMTVEEWREYVKLGLMKQETESSAAEVHAAPANMMAVPSEIDWTAAGANKAVTEVKDQGSCGSCWSFSTTGAIEGADQIKYKSLISFSEQMFVDCDMKSNGGSDMGCNDGLMDSAFDWAHKWGGVSTEKDYPSVSGTTKVRGTCDTKVSKNANAAPKSHTDVQKNSDSAMMSALAMCMFTFAFAFSVFYFRFNEYKNQDFAQHSVQANRQLGIMVEVSKPFFLLKNCGRVFTLLVFVSSVLCSVSIASPASAAAVVDDQGALVDPSQLLLLELFSKEMTRILDEKLIPLNETLRASEASVEALHRAVRDLGANTTASIAALNVTLAALNVTLSADILGVKDDVRHGFSGVHHFGRKRWEALESVSSVWSPKFCPNDAATMHSVTHNGSVAEVMTPHLNCPQMNGSMNILVHPTYDLALRVGCPSTVDVLNITEEIPVQIGDEVVTFGESPTSRFWRGHVSTRKSNGYNGPIVHWNNNPSVRTGEILVDGRQQFGQSGGPCVSGCGYVGVAHAVVAPPTMPNLGYFAAVVPQLVVLEFIAASAHRLSTVQQCGSNVINLSKFPDPDCSSARSNAAARHPVVVD